MLTSPNSLSDALAQSKHRWRTTSAVTRPSPTTLKCGQQLALCHSTSAGNVGKSWCVSYTSAINTKEIDNNKLKVTILKIVCSAHFDTMYCVYFLLIVVQCICIYLLLVYFSGWQQCLFWIQSNISTGVFYIYKPLLLFLIYHVISSCMKLIPKMFLFHNKTINSPYVLCWTQCRIAAKVRAVV